MFRYRIGLQAKGDCLSHINFSHSTVVTAKNQVQAVKLAQDYLLKHIPGFDLSNIWCWQIEKLEESENL